MAFRISPLRCFALFSSCALLVLIAARASSAYPPTVTERVGSDPRNVIVTYVHCQAYVRIPCQEAIPVPPGGLCSSSSCVYDPDVRGLVCRSFADTDLHRLPAVNEDVAAIPDEELPVPTVVRYEYRHRPGATVFGNRPAEEGEQGFREFNVVREVRLGCLQRRECSGCDQAGRCIDDSDGQWHNVNTESFALVQPGSFPCEVAVDVRTEN